MDQSPAARLPWDGYLAGPENALAHASVLALAHGEAAGVSPLIVHGASGVGKTCLLEGLVDEWLIRRPGASVAHLSAEAFAAACAEAAQRREGWGELRERFRALGLFVLDDLHALERAPLALAELAPTLDALSDAGAAVVVSARAGPGQWQGWPSRLVNRLVGGLAVRIDPPGVESRRRFVMDRARSRDLSLPAEVVDRLAERADGYRTLDGWLARLALLARLANRVVDVALADAALADDLADASTLETVTTEAIARAVATRFGVSLRDLRSSSRRQALTVPRHLAIHLSRELTGQSFATLGTYFGHRDPATIRHACAVTADRLNTDPALLAVAEAIAGKWKR